MEKKTTGGVTTPQGRKGRRGLHGASGEVTPRRRPVYPISAERENMRAALRFADAVIATTMPVFEELLEQYREPVKYRQDAAEDFITASRGARFRAAERLGRKTGLMQELEKQAKRAGALAQKHSIQDWNAQVKEALGEEVSTEYYRDGTMLMVENWVRENVSKIGSIPAEYLAEVESIIRWGYETKQPKVNVYRRLEKLNGMTKSKAKMIARDQLGTLNAQMTQYEHESLGVKKYKWITKRDPLVRDCHRALHGTVHSWSEPPQMWYATKSNGIVYTGRFCHPGMDYGCRCTASPVFEMETALKALQNKFKPL